MKENRAQPNPSESQDLVADALHHPADDPVASLVNDDSQHRPFRLIANCAHLVWRHLLAIYHHTFGKLI
jgi:hypothetical protein